MAKKPAPNAVALVSERRLWDRMMAMAEIGAIPGNGVNRACLSKEDIRARRLLLTWARNLKLDAEVDPIGNLFLRRRGTDATLDPVCAGSHMDSQPQGGRFDGIYGVLAVLEAFEALEAAGITTRRPIELVAWTNEEGGRYAPGAMGSMVHAGLRRLDEFLDLTDKDGIRLGDALAETLAAEPWIPRRPLGRSYAAYLEPHIEQGPRLEAEGKTIGVVTGIQGSRWFTVTVTGETAHAGAAPMRGRKDAVQDALRIIAALNELMADPTDTARFTVGRINVSPNTPNSVASSVQFSIDFRHPDRAELLRRGDAIAALAGRAVRDCTVAVAENFHVMPCAFDPLVVDAVQNAAEGLGLSWMRMPSGAFHDAQFMQPLCPTGMIFVPCRKGISHNVAEYAEPAHLAAGTQVLVGALLDLANR
ncbi:MAG: Zn-dependent hydrolase [Alphaproteobacteria bacterium]|nr:Zn-dependent hydrolase [Alphaproteobacteria bacterium]